MKIRFIGGPAEDKEGVAWQMRQVNCDYFKDLPEYFRVALRPDTVPTHMEENPKPVVFRETVYKLERIAYRVGPNHREIIEYCYVWEA